LDSVVSTSKKSIRFHARSFVAFSLAPEAPLAEWLERLDGWTENSPGFFAGRPVVLDLNTLKPDLDGVRSLIGELAARGIRVYAVEFADIDALPLDLPPLLKGAKKTETEETLAEPDEEPKPVAPAGEELAAPNSLTLSTPVRSGQSIFHPHGDVIVLGSVGSGSEIIAGGSVHIYGTLRGRVFAGACGKQDARIFCRKNEAELLAVDGWYRTADDMEPDSRGQPIQAFLQDGVIQVAALN
jgi:septum site-determining protein MinC